MSVPKHRFNHPAGFAVFGVQRSEFSLQSSASEFLCNLRYLRNLRIVIYSSADDADYAEMNKQQPQGNSER